MGRRRWSVGASLALALMISMIGSIGASCPPGVPCAGSQIGSLSQPLVATVASLPGMPRSMAILCGHSAQLPLPGLSQEVGLASPCDSLLASETELLLPVSCPAPFMGKVTGGGDYLDTGQPQSSLAVEGSVDGSQVDLHNGALFYCSAQPNAECIITCTLVFRTIHSPSYAINESCFSAGGRGEDLRKIGVYSTHNHPFYKIHFPCHAIPSYRCVFNDTLYTQEVKVEPDASICGISPPTTGSTPPPGRDDGNATNGTTSIVPDAYDFAAAARAGLIAAAVILVAIIAITIVIVCLIGVIYRDQLRSQGSKIRKMICSCRGNGYIDEGAIEAQLGIPADDGGGEEERVVGFPLPVEGGGGGQQKHNSVQRLVNQ